MTEVRNLDQEFQELLQEPLFWISILILIIFVFIFILLYLYEYISNKIHNSFHKGYDKAKSDKVQYYKTIKEIIDSFEKIYLELTDENSNSMYKANVLELMIDFKDSLQDYYNN